MQRKINKVIEMARALKPQLQDFREFHLAAIFYKERLISIGTNQKKSHPFAVRNGYPYGHMALHAECLAVIRGKLEDYEGHDLIVVRIDNNNLISNSKPCKFCSHLLNRLCFKSILFSDYNGSFQQYIN